jgi:hypothetical protein
VGRDDVLGVGLLSVALVTAVYKGLLLVGLVVAVDVYKVSPHRSEK